jgi:hypothetical protein
MNRNGGANRMRNREMIDDFPNLNSPNISADTNSESAVRYR